ncbi:hypothetical protein U1Q18_036966 [Sarracenia purpurea var. burkii]
MISVEALCEHVLIVSAAPDYCSEQIRSLFCDSRGSSARLVGQKREDIGGRLPTSLLEGRSVISGFVFVPQPWGMLPAKLFFQICSASGSGKSPTNSGSESRSLFRNRLSCIKFGVEPLLANGCRGGTEANLDQASPIHTFSRSAGARDDGPVIPFGSVTGPGFTPAVLRSATTDTGSGWAPTAI